MKRIYEAKKKYDGIEIPSELSPRVAEAIEKSAPKKRSPLFYTKILAPVAVCAAICIAIGLNGNWGEPPIENDEGAVVEAIGDMAVAEKSKSARMVAMNDICQPTAGTEKMNEEVRENDASVIYSGETYISMSRVDEQGKVRYLNFTQFDAEKVSLEMLGIEGYDGETPFYINSDDTVVVIVDGAEKEVEINRG